MADLKKMPREIFIGVAATLISAAIIALCTWWFGGSPSRNPAEIKEGMLNTMRTYCSDLNNRSFDSYRYFAPHVDRYIDMRNTTPPGINKYIKGLFPKQFSNYSTRYDESTFQLTGTADEFYEATIIMYVDYVYEFGQKRDTANNRRTKTELRMNKNFLITSFRLINE